jgi:hypothetical protein
MPTKKSATPKKVAVKKSTAKKAPIKTESAKELLADLVQMCAVKTLEDADAYFFRCPSCKGLHFRHAGYLQTLFPYASPKEGMGVASDSKHVMVCVKCKSSYVAMDGKIINVTKHIDLEAWEEFEVEAERATGPGGEC